MIVLRRSPLKRPAPPLSMARGRQWDGDRLPSPRPTVIVPDQLSVIVTPIPKENAIECEEYRRLVAARPCIFCGIVGYSQCAHPNTAKAKGAKADDRLCFPLCCDRLLVVGCHYQFDQHQFFTRDAAYAFEQHWGARTREGIEADGLWPSNLPRLA